MIKSFATFARIHWPLEYKDYLAEKAWTYSAWKGKRLRQLIKADILNGGSEYKFEDWLKREGSAWVMNENKMAEVAKLFGKKLNEEFKIVTPSGRVRKVKFTTDRGLLYYDRIENEWCKAYSFLNFLCEGKAVIVDE